MKCVVKVLHLSHVAPAKVSSGGRILTQANIEAERQLGLNSEWISLRTNRIPLEFRSNFHFRNVESSIPDDFPSLFWDHRMAYRLAASDKAFDFLTKHIQSNISYIFVLDGPWLWPTLRRFLATQTNLNYRIVYSAHNIEFKLSAMIARGEGSLSSDIDFSTNLLKNDELDLLSASSIATYLSTSDGAELKLYKHNKLVRTYVPGTSIRLKNTNKGRQRRLLDSDVDWFGFVSGDWLPHNLGCIELIKSMHKRKDSNNVGVAIIGGISAGLMRSKEFKNLATNQNLRIFGRVSNEVLSRLDSELSGYVLPVEFGGGMGIKTIEAIQSRKPVFGTVASLRGLEDFKLGNQVSVSEKSEMLWDKMQEWDKNTPVEIRPSILFENEKLVEPSAKAILELSEGLY